MGAVAYRQDFYSWALEQAGLLKEGHLDQLDAEHLIEELQAMSGRERRELYSRLVVLLMHLLKWQHQPNYIGRRSWEKTIKTQRKQIAYHLQDNPGLKHELPTILVRAYDDALENAEDETGIPISRFPPECPWTYEQFMNPDFWPESDK